jgi:hypothetical protein
MDVIIITDRIIEKKSHRRTCENNIKHFERLIEEEKGFPATPMYSKFVADNKLFQYEKELENWKVRLSYAEEDIRDLRLKLKYPNY